MYYSADLSGLEESIKSNPGKEIQCISGNTDPFSNWEKTKFYFEKIKEIADRNKKDLIVRTKILPLDPDLLKKFKRIELVISPDDKKMFEKLAMTKWWIKTATTLSIFIEANSSIPSDRLSEFESELRCLGISSDINYLSV